MASNLGSVSASVGGASIGICSDLESSLEPIVEASATDSNAEKSEAIDVSRNKDKATEVFSCGVWRLGEPFEDQAKIAAALDRLGPFVLDSYDCPLPLIQPESQSLAELEEGSQHVRGLQELQLNDVVEPSIEESLSKSVSEGESVEEVSDRVFVEREVEGETEVDQYPSKRKRRDFRFAERSNFVKHNLRHKRRKFRKKPKRHKAPQRAPAAPLKPLSQEGIC